MSKVHSSEDFNRANLATTFSEAVRDYPANGHLQDSARAALLEADQRDDLAAKTKILSAFLERTAKSAPALPSTLPAPAQSSSLELAASAWAWDRSQNRWRGPMSQPRPPRSRLLQLKRQQVLWRWSNYKRSGTP